jgi:hypothetical protein
MKLLYKPFSIVAKIIGKRVGKTAFAHVWAQVADSERPPSPSDYHESLVFVAGAAALEAATLAAVGAIIDQLSARAFHHLFGAWPGKPAEPHEADVLDAPADAPAATSV